MSAFSESILECGHKTAATLDGSRVPSRRADISTASPDLAETHKNGFQNGRQQRLTQPEPDARDCTMSIRKTRNVSLTPELEAFIDGRVAAGRYRSASEVVRASLRMLEDAEAARRGVDGAQEAPAGAAVEAQ